MESRRPRRGGVFFSCVDIDEGNFSDLLDSLPAERRKQAIDALPRFNEICDEHLGEESRLRVWHSQVFVSPGDSRTASRSCTSSGCCL